MRRLAAVALVALVACGGPAITPEVSAELTRGVREIRQAAAAPDLPAAREATETLRSRVLELRERDELGAEKAAEILAALAEVEEHLSLLPEPTPVPTPVPTRPPAPTPDDDDIRKEVEKRMEELRKEIEERQKEREKENEDGGGQGQGRD